IDNIEICDACWFSYDNLPEIPEAGTIAGQLIRYYIRSL
ncbi:MAG: NAD(+) diphosphatase, partial [Desulfopila sp.]